MSATRLPMRASFQGAALVVLLGCAVSSAPGQASVPAGRPVIVVQAVDGTSYGMRFEPVRITVQPGDTVRFLQAGGLPHNVEFKSTPDGTALGGERVGPLLYKRGETYDLVIDQRFAIGKHMYVCTPHEALGMAGLIYVSERPKGPHIVP